MNNVLIGVMALISILISYAPTLSRYYVSLFPNQNEYIAPFNFDPSEDSKVISAQIRGGDFWKDKVLNLGIFWPTPTLTCNRVKGVRKILVNEADRNSVLLIDGAQFGGCENISLKVSKSDRYHIFGVLSGKALITDRETSDRIKRLTEFFSRDIRLLLLVVVFLSLFANYYMSHLASAGLAQASVLERHAVAWGLYLLFSSGTMEAFMPWVGASALAGSLTSYFSAVAHVAPGVDYIFTRSGRQLPSRKWYFLIFAAIILVDNRIDALMIFLVPTALAVFALTTYGMRDFEFFVFSALLIVNASKLLAFGTTDPAVFPHVHLAPIYVGQLIVWSCLVRFKYASTVTRMVVWLSQFKKVLSLEEHLFHICSTTRHLLGASRVSILINKENSCELFLDSDSSEGRPKSEQLASLPPMFAAVFTSGEPIFLEDEDSDRSVRLRKGQRSTGLGKYSIIPLIVRGEVLGAVSIAGPNLATDIITGDTHRRVAGLLREHLERLLEARNEEEVLKNHRGLAEAIEKLRPVEGEDPTHQSLERLALALSCQVTLYTHIEAHCEYRVISAHNFSGSEAETAKNIRVGENSENEHGPLLLSVRNKKDVIVNNIALIQEVLTPRTKQFMELCSTRSLGVFPVLFSDDPVSRVLSVLTVQSKERDFFNLEKQELLRRYALVLGQAQNLTDAKNSARIRDEMLASFVPGEVRDKLIRGEITRIEAFGYLGCIDLIGSTKLLNKYGNAMFKSLIDALTLTLTTSVRDECRLTAMNWDAFYLESQNLKPLLQVFKELQMRSKSLLADLGIDFQLEFRLCLTNGDTSQDFSESEGFKRWTIVGSAMAEVCKFEQKIKKFGPGIYIDEKAFRSIKSEELMCSFEQLVDCDGYSILSSPPVRSAA